MNEKKKFSGLSQTQQIYFKKMRNQPFTLAKNLAYKNNRVDNVKPQKDKNGAQQPTRQLEEVPLKLTAENQRNVDNLVDKTKQKVMSKVSFLAPVCVDGKWRSEVNKVASSFATQQRRQIEKELDEGMEIHIGKPDLSEG